MESPNEQSNELSDALRENREEAQSLKVHEDAKKQAAKALGLGVNPAGTWGKKTDLHFKAYYDPPKTGSIHYWLAYGREILAEARLKKVYLSEIKCAAIGLHSFAKGKDIHNLAARRIYSDLHKLSKTYRRV